MNKLQARSDEELISILRDGVASAITELYERYWKFLLAKAFDRLKSREDAEEIVQELFVKIWRRRQNIQLKYSFKTYILASLRYEILHHIAKQQYRKDDISLNSEEFNEFWVQDEAFHSLEIKQLQEKIEKVINTLPEKCKIIFKMSRNEGMSANQIANELKLSPRTIETQIGKALKILKKHFRGPDSYILVLICEFLLNKR